MASDPVSGWTFCSMNEGVLLSLLGRGETDAPLVCGVLKRSQGGEMLLSVCPALRRCKTTVRSPHQSGHVADSRRAEAGMYHAEDRAGRSAVFRMRLVRASG